MEAVLAILKINETIVYSIYGQVFFSLGLVVALYSRRHSQLDLARQLAWLAAFGLTHGLYEWAYVFIPVQATYLPQDSTSLLIAARAILLAFSFFFLSQFGCLLAFPDGRTRLVARAAFAAGLVAWLAWALFGTDLIDGRGFPASAWARRLLGLPASAIASIGMFRQARAVAGGGLRNIARDFRIASVSFAAYAFLAGFVVSPSPDSLVAQLPILGFALQASGLSAPVLRSIAGLGMVFGIVRGLRIFEIETDRLLEAAERARLKSAERARRAMESMAGTVSANRALNTLLPAALREVMTLVDSNHGWLTLSGGEGNSFRLMARVGLERGEDAKGECLPSEECLCVAVSQRDGAITIPPGARCRLFPAEIKKGSWAAIPLTAHARALGVMHIQGGPFTSEMLGLLTSLGRQLGLAVENAELAGEVAQKELARAQLLRKAITAQEEERRRVARELHDQTGQSLIGVIMTLGAAGDRLENGPRKVLDMVEDARQVAVQALESTREMIMGLRPAALDDLGLVPALRRFAEDLGRKHHMSLSIESTGLSQRLPPDMEVVMFRILQECLNNVIRHSRARGATVRLDCEEREVRAEITDDGCGFDLPDAIAHPETGRGLGLLGMTERASLLGGTVTLRTAPNRGTTVLVRIPLPVRSEAAAR